jgi:hypothetical protein
MENTQNPQENPMLTPDHGNHMGPIIGSIIIIVLLALGGLYFWSKELQKEKPAEVEQNPALQGTTTLNSSDEVSSIEADIESTNFNDIDADLKSLETELQ